MSEWTIVIPARLSSRRFPGKLLIEIDGRSILEHVWRVATNAADGVQVTVLTDTVDLANHVHRFGGLVELTSAAARNGTERAAEHLASHRADAVMNVQADDPFVTPELLRSAMVAHDASGGAVTTPAYRLDGDRAADPSVVKVVHGIDWNALYFSRAPIPVFRDDEPRNRVRWGHVGLYCYRRDALEHYAALPEGHLERAEKLEQLRFLEHGIPVRTFETSYVPSAIDTPADLFRLKQDQAVDYR